MAIRIRKIDGHMVALCAAKTKKQKGDIYLDDNLHQVLGEKFHADYVKMGFIKKEERPQKRPLTVDEIISKYPMTVRILLVQLVEQIERLQKNQPQVSEEFVEKWNQVIAERVNVQMKKDFIRSEIGLVYPGTENLIQMLKEAGVEIAGSKKKE